MLLMHLPQAMGVLAFELIVGRPPFERESRSSTYEAIMYRRPHFPLWISDAAREFITLALVKVSSPRVTAFFQTSACALTLELCAPVEPR